MALKRRPGPVPACDCAARVAELEALCGALVEYAVKFARLAKGDTIERGLTRGGVPEADARRIAAAWASRRT